MRRVRTKVYIERCRDAERRQSDISKNHGFGKALRSAGLVSEKCERDTKTCGQRLRDYRKYCSLGGNVKIDSDRLHWNEYWRAGYHQGCFRFAVGISGPRLSYNWGDAAAPGYF